ncbi:MAG: peptide-methionine (S)-S-oxide reductase MsrA, partial [Gammaproteobacteria bacterium]|nr:peptide-methionine (S)-S-oxide reductase MsrA [Gammaproteobacteria bacterium]
TGHAEVVQVTFDADVVSYEQLLKDYWKDIDPTVKDQQFCDHGSQYRTIIFYNSPQQEKLARQSLKDLEQYKPFAGPIYTEITPAQTFYPAEDYHQNYYKKNPIRYRYYRFACGRDSRLEEIWGSSSH